MGETEGKKEKGIKEEGERGVKGEKEGGKRR